jgi:hypothetical protein
MKFLKYFIPLVIAIIAIIFFASPIKTFVYHVVGQSHSIGSIINNTKGLVYLSDHNSPVDPVNQIAGAGPVVLGASDELNNITFNIPSNFNDSVTIKDLTLDGQLNIKSSVKADGQTFDLGNGVLKASNIIYGIAAGAGLLVDDSQNPTISNTGVLSLGGQSGDVNLEAGSGITIDGLKISATGFTATAGTGISVDGNTISNNDSGSSQSIFKTISVLSQNSINAGSNSDTLTFEAGSGITLTTNASTKTLTIAAGGVGGGVTGLNSLTGGLTLVGGGINSVSTAGSTITVTGTEADTLSSITGRGASTSTAVAFNGGLSTSNLGTVAGVSTSLNPTGPNLYDLGSSTANQYNNIYSQAVYQNGNQVCDASGNCTTSGAWTQSGSNVYLTDNTANVGIGVSNPTEKLTVAGNIVPSADLTYDLGSSALRFRHVYADNVAASGSATFGDVVIQGKTNQIVDNTNLANGKAVYVYEVKKDADTGKWINSEKIQASSWYNETIDADSSSCSLASDDRCGSRSFPPKVEIIATDTNVYIYDAKDNSLWMKIATGSGYSLDSSSTINDIFALNGSLYIATTKGLVQYDFITDRVYRFDYHSGSGGRASYLGNIGDRNSNKGYGGRSAWGQIASDKVNGVSATLINGKLFVAVSTLGGASVINISDQKVVRYINH